jgi:hypothetical protein
MTQPTHIILHKRYCASCKKYRSVTAGCKLKPKFICAECA